MIRAALLGLGKMGISHLSIANAHPNIELRAICDTTEYIAHVLSKYGKVRAYTDYRKMLANEELDAVIVATPSKRHAEMVRAALDANLHVFCEKPFCLDLAEGLRLVQLAEEKGRVNQVGYHYRFVGVFHELRRILDLKALGRIHHIRAEAHGPVVLRPKGGTWRAVKNEGGGCLYDYAIHAIDLANYLVGRPTAVGGVVTNNIFSRDVEDEVYASIYYEGGMSGHVAANWSDDSNRKMSVKITLWGTNGKIIADRQELQIYLRDDTEAPKGLRKGWNVRYTTDLTDNVWFYLRGEEYSAQIDHFVQSIEDGRTDTRSTFRSAVEADLVAAAIAQGVGGGMIAVSPEIASGPSPRKRRFWDALQGTNGSNDPETAQ